MHAEFDLRLLREKLAYGRCPSQDAAGRILTDEKGRLLIDEQASGKPYQIFDTSRDAPKGLFIKVGATSKTLYLQVRHDSRVVKTKIGDLRDFPDLKSIYAKGFEVLALIRQEGRNPNTVRRERALEDYTLDQIFDDYVDELKRREKKVAQNTFIAIEKGRKKLACWKTKRVSELTSTEITEKFQELKNEFPTATEQAFRWASVATKRKIEFLKFDAKKAGKSALLVNPFDVLVHFDMYRSREQLEKEYKAKGVRNPLSLDDSLGVFLNLLWDRRKYRHTAVDYILCEVLWGCRKSEHRVLKWIDFVPPNELDQHSWVDLDKRLIFFHSTKNGRAHELPLAPMAEKLLHLRQELRAEELEHTPKGIRHQYVFPAQAKTSRSGHYANPKEMLDSVAAQMEAQSLKMEGESARKVVKITPHDLRRTFGRVAESLGLSTFTIKKLLNHYSGDVSLRYMEPELKRLREHMSLIEKNILAKAPRIYNALLPAGEAPIPETPWTVLPYRKDQRAKLASG